MDFQELITKRYSCRHYSDRPVAADDLRLCLEAARLSPSACNSQPWHLYAVSEETKRKQLARATQVRPGSNSFSDQAPLLIVITTETEPQVRPFVKETLGAGYFSDIDAGICAAHLTLQAAELGLATCIMGMFDEPAVRGLLAIPETERIRLVVALGYAAADDQPAAKRRRPAEENVRCF